MNSIEVTMYVTFKVQYVIKFKTETSFKAITITALLNSIYQEMFQPEGTILIAQKRLGTIQ